MWDVEDARIEALMRPPVRSLVSVRRQRATAQMALFALTSLLAGDIVEAGVFHGGTTVLMARVLRNVSSKRRLWACDSFKGLPRAQQEDRGGNCSALLLQSNGDAESGESGGVIPRRSCKHGHMAMYYSPRNTVETALRGEGLSEYVHIVPGWFHESLPPVGLRSIGFLRLDGDTYNGTYEALRWLYPLVVDGGIVYVDDAGSYKGAAMALKAYFSRNIGTPIREEEGFYDAVWWRK